MKKKRVFYIILIVAVISLMSWLLYYLVWFLFDPDLRMEFYKGWPFHPLEMLLDYVVCCFVTFGIPAVFHSSKANPRGES